MADQFFYNHHVKFHGSSVLDEAFYSDEKHRLYIRFLNGSIAGYQEVTPNIFQSLTNADSPGQYYNYSIKNFYRGTHNDVVFVPKTPEQQSPVVTNVTGAADAPTGNTSKPDYVVKVAVNGTLEFTVPAVNARAAIQNVEQILLNSGAVDGSFEIEGVNKV